MLKVFVDTTVLFAAVYSATGYARDLIKLATEGKVQLIVSQRVTTEMERNLQKKAPQQLPSYRLLMATLVPDISAEPTEVVAQVETYLTAKDAPIVAAAISAKVDYLVTFDFKHLLNHPEVSKKSGLRIVTPDVVVQAVQAEHNKSPKKPE